MASLWLDSSDPIASDPLTAGDHDVVVVGAGLTGLTTALLLARAGRGVRVVEARHVGAVTTGHTTAKVSLLQGTHLSRVRRHQGLRTAMAYVDSQREGAAWLLRFCEDHGVPVQRRTSFTYAASPGEVSSVEKEHAVASSLGLPVRLLDHVEAPFAVHRATALDDQAQFDPLDVLEALVEQLRAHGGTLHQGQRVVGASARGGVDGGPALTLEDATELRCREAVLATGAPLLDRGLHFAEVEPQRSYSLTFRVPEDTAVPDGMFLSAGSDSRSIRDVPREDGPLLLVGGAGHTVGRTRSELEHVDRLRRWTHDHFPGAVETHRWSAQDYAPHDALPFVGRVPRGGGHLRFATGFEKWGMTDAVAAARVISGEILGAEPSWAGALHTQRLGPADVGELLRLNLGVGLSVATGAARGLGRRVTGIPPEGTGTLGRDGVVPTGRATTPEGEVCEVVGLCTHLGGVLKWNDAERSWDCPLHGSRFAPDGEVLEGPATKRLRRR